MTFQKDQEDNLGWNTQNLGPGTHIACVMLAHTGFKWCVWGRMNLQASQYILQGTLNLLHWHKYHLFNLAPFLDLPAQIPILLTQLTSHLFSIKLDTGSESLIEYMKVQSKKPTFVFHEIWNVTETLNNQQINTSQVKVQLIQHTGQVAYGRKLALPTTKASGYVYKRVH